jgi:hypothetical protein
MIPPCPFVSSVTLWLKKPQSSQRIIQRDTEVALLGNYMTFNYYTIFYGIRRILKDQNHFIKASFRLRETFTVVSSLMTR